jgi:excisionase family DNA binding protein
MTNIAKRVLLTVADLCQATGLGRTTLYSQIKQGRLRARKCGRRTLFHCDDIASWLDGLPEILPSDARHAATPAHPQGNAESSDKQRAVRCRDRPA